MRHLGAAHHAKRSTKCCLLEQSLSGSHAAHLRWASEVELTDLRTSAQLCWKALTSAGIRGPCSAASASACPMSFTSAAQHCSSVCRSHADKSLEDVRLTTVLSCSPQHLQSRGSGAPSKSALGMEAP